MQSTKTNHPARTDIVRARVRLLAALSYARSKLYRMARSGKTATGANALCKPFDDAIKAIRNNAHRHYLSDSIDRPGYQIAYAQTPKHKYDADKRTRTSLARYLNRNFRPIKATPDKVVEIFCGAVFTYLFDAESDDRFRIISGFDISDFYYHDYDASGGCMSGHTRNEYVRVYERNPETVRMLVMDDIDGKGRKARALLWSAESYSKGERYTILDRIYPNSGSHVDAMRKYAKAHGWHTRAHNALPDGTEYPELPEDICVELNFDGCDYAPYMDSFCETDDGEVFYTKHHACDYTLNSTSGERPWADGAAECYNCGVTITQHDIDYGDGVVFDDDGDAFCEHCYFERYARCERCSSECLHDDAMRVPDASSYGGENWCISCVDTHTISCDSCGAIRAEDYSVSDDTGECYCDECAAEYFQQCDDCGDINADTRNHNHNANGVYCAECHPHNLDDDELAAREADRSPAPGQLELFTTD